MGKQHSRSSGLQERTLQSERSLPSSKRTNMLEVFHPCSLSCKAPSYDDDDDDGDDDYDDSHDDDSDDAYDDENYDL